VLPEAAVAIIEDQRLDAAIDAILLSNGLRAGSLETVSTSEFLKLPGDFQALYVAGILDGMSYVTHNYEIPNGDQWVACVRTKTLGATLTDVLAYMKANPSEAKYPVPWAVAKTIGQRPCAAR
jgi:hypothetical protein